MTAEIVYLTLAIVFAIALIGTLGLAAGVFVGRIKS